MGCKAVVVCQCRVEWLSRWLLMAHWRCTKAFDLSFLSASLPCARLSTLSILVSASRVSLALSRSIFLLPGAALRRVVARAAVRRRCSSLFPEQRIHTYIHVHIKFPSIGRFHSSVSLFPSRFRVALFPDCPSTHSSLRLRTHRPFSSPSPRPTRAYSPLRPAFIAQQNLHDSLNDKRNRALSVL